MTSITDEASDERRVSSRRDDDQPSFGKMLGTALAVISIAGSVFVAGYNWRSVAILEAQQDQFVRKDVQSEQMNNLRMQNSEIMRQIEELRGELRAARRKE